LSCVLASKEEEEESSKGEDAKIEEKEIQPVGQDYIEEIKNDEGEERPNKTIP
jgi:hypothetical protein